MIRLARGPFGTYIIENLDDSGATGDFLAQIDWDYPGIAGTFGWSLRSVADPRTREVRRGPDDAACDMRAGRGWVLTLRDAQRLGLACDHAETDGTVPCSCGLTAIDFIGAADDWLSDHIGATADDPGYFAAD